MNSLRSVVVLSRVLTHSFATDGLYAVDCPYYQWGQMQNRRGVPVNSLSLSGGSFHGSQSGGFNASNRVTTPARASTVNSFNTTVSPTRRSAGARNASDGVAAALGSSSSGHHHSTSPSRPGTRGRYDALSGQGAFFVHLRASSEARSFGDPPPCVVLLPRAGGGSLLWTG